MWIYSWQAVCKVTTAQGFTAVVYSVLCLCLVVSPGSALREKRDSYDDIIETRSGQTVVLPCNETLPTPPPEAATFLPYITQWKRTDIGSIYVSFGGAPPFINQQYNGRVSLVDLKSLKIDDVRPEDEGWYECQIVLLDGDLRNTENGTFTHLIVIGPPRFIKTSDRLVTYKEGDEARIECIAKGTPTPTLSWYKNGQPVVPGRHISVTSDSVLFNGVTREDAGTYLCRAESEEGFVESEVRLLIKGAPYIFMPPHDTTVTRDQDAVFQCEAEASPSNITQRWFFNDIPVETSRELEGRWVNLPEGGLMVHDVVPGDEGWFTCSPTNGLGEPPQATAFLTVQYPAYVVSMPMRIFVTRGLDTILTCDVDAKPPVDYIVWFKDGEQIAIRRLPRYNQEDDGSLVITSAELDDSGEYTCEPYNSLGTAGQSTGTALIVRDPPVFVTKPKALYQQAKGKDITIPCSASGDPTPQIEWIKVNGEIPPYRSTVTRTSLTIRDLIKSDHGVYECRATNEIATIVTSTTLYVEFTSPHPPYNITIVTHITSVHASWQPAYDGGYPQTYTIRYRPAVDAQEDKGWTSMGGIAGDVTAILIYNLESSTSYEFAVIATNQLGDSLASNPIFATTRGLIPSPPRNITISISREGLVLTWEAPVHFADLVENYAVEYRIDGSWLVLNDRINTKKRRLLLNSLQANTTYQFRVFAFTPAAFSDPSQVITENTGDLSRFAPRPTGAKFGGPPGIIAGIIAGLCFLLLALILSILAICLSHRRRKKKRLMYFKANQNSLEGKQSYEGYEMTYATSQTPQKLIHSPTRPNKKNTNLLRSSLAKLKVKLSPKTSQNESPNPSARRGLYHVNNNSNHNSPNGKISIGGMERSLSDQHLSPPPGNSASYRVEIDLSNFSAQMSRETEKQLASEEALGMEDLRMINVQLHDSDYQKSEGSYTHAYYNASADATTNDNCSETSYPTSYQDDSESPLRPGDTDSDVGRRDYVYYHGRMFVANSSTDDNDSAGFENGGLEVDENGGRSPKHSPCYNSNLPLSRMRDASPPKYTDAIRQYSDIPSNQNRYVDMPMSQTDLSLNRSRSSQKKTPPPKYSRNSSLPNNYMYNTNQDGDSPAKQSTDDNSHIPRQSDDLRQQSGQSTLSTIPGSPPDVQVSFDSEMESGYTSFRAPKVNNEFPNRSPRKSLSSSPERTSSASHGAVGNVYKTKLHISPKPKVSPKPVVSTKTNVSPTRQSQKKDYSIYGNVNTPDYRQNRSPDVRTTPELNPYRSANDRNSDRRHGSPESTQERTNNSPDWIRLYNNSTNSQSDINRHSPCDHTYASVQDTLNCSPESRQPGGLNENLRETSLPGGSHHASSPESQQSPYKNEQLSPVWQKQHSSNTPERHKSPLYSTFDPKTSFSTSPSARGSVPSYSPSSQYQRDPVVIHRGRVPEEQVPSYAVDSLTACLYTSTDESCSNSRASITSTSASSESTCQPYLPHTPWQPHVRDLTSPHSYYSGVSSGYGSRFTPNDTSPGDHINNTPNINETSPVTQQYDSSTCDYFQESYTNLCEEESQVDNEEFDPASLSELMSALQRLVIPVPRDTNYDTQSEKPATMEARCAELKKEMQECQRQQSQISNEFQRQSNQISPERQPNQISPVRPGRTLSRV